VISTFSSSKEWLNEIAVGAMNMRSLSAKGDGVFANLSKSKMIRLYEVRDGKIQGEIEMSPKEAGDLITIILGLTTAASLGSAELPVYRQSEKNRRYSARVTRFALGGCVLPGTESLTVIAGDAQVGLAISRRAIRELGQALLALSASTPPQ
jgi:hypothetical protein